jgi:hypothetical protein
VSFAACNESARLNFTPSSPNFFIILAIPAVETVILFGDIFKPSSELNISNEGSFFAGTMFLTNSIYLETLFKNINTKPIIDIPTFNIDLLEKYDIEKHMLNMD